LNLFSIIKDIQFQTDSIKGLVYSSKQIWENFSSEVLLYLIYIYQATHNKKTSMLKLAGYTLLTISAISFLMILVIPWFGYSKGEIAGIITGLIIIGEVTFYLSIFILGKTFWEKIKGYFRFGKEKTTP
jgi:hypothetical protein